MEWMDAICIQMGLGLDLVNKLRFTSNSWSRSAVVSLLGDDDDLSPGYVSTQICACKMR